MIIDLKEREGNMKRVKLPSVLLALSFLIVTLSWQDASATVYTIKFADGHRVWFDPTIVGQTVETPDDNTTLIDTSYAVGDSITPDAWVLGDREPVWTTAENNRIITDNPETDLYSLGFHESYRPDDLWHSGFTSAPLAVDPEVTDVWDILNLHLLLGTEYTLRADKYITFAKTTIISLDVNESLSFADDVATVPVPPGLLMFMTALPLLLTGKRNVKAS